MYEGIQSEVISTTRFDENFDLSTTYVGRVDITRVSKIKARIYGRKAIGQNRM